MSNEAEQPPEEKKLQEGEPEPEKTQNVDPEGQEDDPHFIGEYETAPHYMKDNQHITHGYRIGFDTPRKILRSLFMIHNESVNIWSHCLPAIFLIVFIITFYLMVDGQSMRRNFKDYQQGLQKGVDHYMHALHNLTLIAQYQQFSKKRVTEIESLKRTVMDNYVQFTNKFHETSKRYHELLEEEVEDIKLSIKDSIKHNTAQFEKAKRQFELILAPFLVHEIHGKLNSTWFNNLKEKAEALKQSIDSDSFQMIELHQYRPGVHEVSRWPIMVFLVTAVICLLCSSIFHLFYPMSSRTYTITNRFDYAGINLLISGSAFPPIYYGMYCQIEVAIFYLTITLMVATVCFVVCLFQWIHKPGHEKYKGLMYGGFGSSLVIPLIHMIINENFYENYGDGFQFLSSMPYYLLLGASYLGGLYVYVVRCPEKNNPGRYNMCGHSHQIWHGFVVLGIFFTYMGALATFQMRKNSICPA